MSGAGSRRKGATYERKIATWLSERFAGLVTFSRRLEQWRSGGDDLVHGWEDWLSIEVKNVAATSLGAWVDQSVESAGSRIAVVIHHRRGNGDPARDFATLPLSDFAELVELASASGLTHDMEVER